MSVASGVKLVIVKCLSIPVSPPPTMLKAIQVLNIS